MKFKRRVGSVLAMAAVIIAIPLAALAYQPNNQFACVDSGNSKCIEHVSGGLLVVAQSSVGNDDRLTWETADSSCNSGVVSATQACPFASGSGLNSTYNGKAIGCLHFANVGGYIQGVALGNQDGITSNCGDTGTFFVEAGTGNKEFINVYTSNHTGPNYVGVPLLAGVSQGSNVVTDNFFVQQSDVLWGPCSGC